MKHTMYQAIQILKKAVSAMPILPKTQESLLAVDEETVSQKVFLQLILSDVLAVMSVLLHVKKNIKKLDADVSTVDKGVLMMGIHPLKTYLGQVAVVQGSAEVLSDMQTINQFAQCTARIGALLAKMRFDINEHELVTACLCAFVPALLSRAFNPAYTKDTLAMKADEAGAFEAISFLFNYLKTPLCYVEFFHPQFFESPRTMVIRDSIALATAIHQEEVVVLAARIQKIAEAHRIDPKTMRERIFEAAQVKDPTPE